MTPKEKAKELVDKLTLSSNAQDGSWMCSELAKQCALIAVDERMKPEPLNGNVLARKYFLYWTEVKQEIESL